MSFGQPPPKTPYGDQDFIKEDWNPQQPTFAPPTTSASPPPPSAYLNRHQGVSQNVPYSALVPPQPSSNTLQQGPYGGQRQQQNQPDVANLVQSLTPEDQIFMRSWRRDSFFYRVLPLSAIGSGALYFYNQSKNLPHKPSRYLLVSFGSYVIGKWSYKGELKTRLETSPSNTPFIKALRELLGVKSSMAELGTEFSGDFRQDSSVGSGSLDDLPQQANPGYGRFGASETNPQAQPYGQQPYGAYDQPPPYLPSESDLSLAPPGEGNKSMTSYDELRARNRGLIQK